MTDENMNIKKEPIETMRFSKERRARMKGKSIEITLKIKDLVTEADLVNYLIDTQLDKIDVSKEGNLYIRESKE